MAAASFPVHPIATHAIFNDDAAMRIDFVITELFVGGAERCLTELAIGMAATGDEVRVFSIGTLPGGQQSVLVDRLRAGGVEVSSGQADSPLRFAAAYRRLGQWFAASPPDVCQTFMFHANVLGTFAASAQGVPIRVGGLRVAEARRVRLPLERAAVARMTSLVCVSSAVKDFASTKLKCATDKSVIIPNGVDITRFASAQPVDWSTLGWPPDASVTLFVGRLHSQKGIDRLQQEIDSIAPRDSSQKLLIVGDGPLKQSLDRWCERIGADRVKRLPWQSDVAPWMRACRLLVLPSRYEGMPNVAMEAMAAARPVVCSRVEGAKELFAHSWESQTFDVGDDESMTRLIRTFSLDSSLADRTGEINQERMRNEFSIPAMLDAYRSHYRLLRTRRLDD